MINILPLSPSSFSTFQTCPFKFFCQKDTSIVPLPQKDNIYAFFGRNLHKLIQQYYLKVMQAKEFEINNIHPTLSDVIGEQTPKLGIENINKGYTTHLRNFEEFEEERIKNEWKVLAVEKRIVSKGLKGFIDAIFRDSDNNTIVVDWKTGKWRDEFLMQGYVYKLLSKADKVMFFQSLNGFEHKLKDRDLMKGKNMAQNILNQMRRGINERRRNRFCGDCEYSLACGLSEVKMKLEEV